MESKRHEEMDMEAVGRSEKDIGGRPASGPDVALFSAGDDGGLDVGALVAGDDEGWTPPSQKMCRGGAGGGGEGLFGFDFGFNLLALGCSRSRSQPTRPITTINNMTRIICYLSCLACLCTVHFSDCHTFITWWDRVLTPHTDFQFPSMALLTSSIKFQNNFKSLHPISLLQPQNTQVPMHRITGIPSNDLSTEDEGMPAMGSCLSLKVFLGVSVPPTWSDGEAPSCNLLPCGPLMSTTTVL